MTIRLQRARRSQMPIIRNLVRYYVYDFSEHMGWPCSADGKFGGCDDLPRYWKQKGNAPFLIRSGRELVVHAAGPAAAEAVRGRAGGSVARLRDRSAGSREARGCDGDRHLGLP